MTVRSRGSYQLNRQEVEVLKEAQRILVELNEKILATADTSEWWTEKVDNAHHALKDGKINLIPEILANQIRPVTFESENI